MQIVNNRLLLEAQDGSLKVVVDQGIFSVFGQGKLLHRFSKLDAVIAASGARVELHGNAVGICCNNSFMWAFAGVRLWARGGRVFADRGSKVLAEEDSEVHAFEGSHVTGKAFANIFAYGGSQCIVSWQTSVLRYAQANVHVHDLSRMPQGEVPNKVLRRNPDHVLVEGTMLL